MSVAVTEWWLVRHAPVENPTAFVYGALDLEAILPPPEEMEALAAVLPPDPVWMDSGMARARRTLEALLEARGAAGAEIRGEPGFAEQDFGEWEGRTREELWRELNRPGVSWTDLQPPGGERFSDVARRVAAAAEAWSRRLPGRSVVAVVHAGSVRGFLSAALGLGPDAAAAFAVENLSVTRCDRFDSGAWRVPFVNRLASPRRRS